MPSLLTRYVLTELLKVFLVGLIAITMLIVLVGVATEAVKQGLGFGAIIQLIPYIMPEALRFSIPATILFATCMVFGRMSGANEFTAVKSLGGSPMVLFAPVFVFAFFLSLVSVWVNDMAVTWGHTGVQRVIVHSAEEIIYGMLRTRKSYTNQNMSISVKSVEDRQLIGLTVLYSKPGSDSSVTLTAEKAELYAHPEEESLCIVVTNFLIDDDRQGTFSDPGTTTFDVPLESVTKNKNKRNSPSNTPLLAIPAESVRQRTVINETGQHLAAEAAFEMLTGDFDSLMDSQWEDRRNSLTSARQRLDRLQAEPWRRWAIGFSCFCFVLVGAPLSVRMKNSDVMTSFFVCFLPILLLYYPLLIFGVERAKAGDIPPYSAWAGNVLMVIIGIYLLRKASRY